MNLYGSDEHPGSWPRSIVGDRSPTAGIGTLPATAYAGILELRVWDYTEAALVPPPGRRGPEQAALVLRTVQS